MILISLIISLASLSPAYQSSGAVVLDRIAAIAGKHVIKSSDIERDVRLTEFLNREPLSLTPERKRKSADRLIDQAIIRDDIASGAFSRAGNSDATALVAQLRSERFGGSDSRLRQALSQYGLTEDDLNEELLWQLTVLRFIDQRFRTGVLVTDEDVQNYYNQHLADLKRRYPRDYSFEALEPLIRSQLEGQRVTGEFESWLDAARKQQHIEYRQGAFE